VIAKDVYLGDGGGGGRVEVGGGGTPSERGGDEGSSTLSETLRLMDVTFIPITMHNDDRLLHISRGIRIRLQRRGQ